MPKPPDRTQTDEHGVRWLEFDRRTDRLVTKERIFRSEAALERFIEKLPDRPRFYAFDAFLP